ncbi:MAG: hypothetical protein AAFS00_08970, partial [Bacteroidota bacterium]
SFCKKEKESPAAYVKDLEAATLSEQEEDKLAWLKKKPATILDIMKGCGFRSSWIRTIQKCNLKGLISHWISFTMSPSLPWKMQ